MRQRWLQGLELRMAAAKAKAEEEARLRDEAEVAAVKRKLKKKPAELRQKWLLPRRKLKKKTQTPKLEQRRRKKSSR